MDHILGHKTSLNEFKRMEIISSIFSNHSSIKLEINYKKKTAKTTNTWRLNNMLLKNNRGSWGFIELLCFFFQHNLIIHFTDVV